MTVLTVPLTGVKPDKVPLVNDADRGARPPPSYHPKLLESGSVSANDEPCFRFRLIMYRVVLGLFALMSVFVVVVLARHALCRSHKRDVALMQRPNLERLGTVEDVAPSYDASETDNLPVLPPSSDYAGSPDRMEDLYNRFGGFDLSKTLGAQPAASSGDYFPAFNRMFFADLERDGGRATSLTATKSARFIHDFSVNVTGIVDVEAQRCYVMPLVRDSASPPANLYDLLFKMSSGYYSMDVQKIMGGMRAVEPPVKDLSAYGLYISKDCADYATYRLEKADEPNAVTSTVSNAPVSTVAATTTDNS